MSENMEQMAEAIAESLTLSGALDEAGALRDASLAADPEWSVPEWTHLKGIVAAFVVGVIDADVWHRGYKLPPDTEGVVNWIAFNVQRRWPNEDVVQVSLIELKALFMEWGMEHPSFRKWNETDKMVGVVSRYSATPDERDFIDLGALVHNAVLYLRMDRREFKAFNERFDREQAESRAATPTSGGTP